MVTIKIVIISCCHHHINRNCYLFIGFVDIVNVIKCQHHLHCCCNAPIKVMPEGRGRGRMARLHINVGQLICIVILTLRNFISSLGSRMGMFECLMTRMVNCNLPKVGVFDLILSTSKGGRLWTKVFNDKPSPYHYI